MKKKTVSNINKMLQIYKINNVTAEKLGWNVFYMLLLDLECSQSIQK